jgi:SET domain-containing protein
MQRLFERNVAPDDENSIIRCIAELKKDYLPKEDPLKIRAAVDIRLRRFEELKQLYGLADTDSSMYGTVISRAIDLGDGTLAVIPMFDMVNHSMDPNLVLSIDFEDGMVDMKATRPIKKGEEMFVSYHDEENPDNEFGSLWVSHVLLLLDCPLAFCR